MKKLLFISAIFISVFANAQSSTTNVFCLAPSCNQTVQLPISIDTLFARLTTADGYKSITWKQVSGPNTAIMGTPITNLTNSTVGASIQPISGLIAGTYVFQCTGLSTGGTAGSAQVSLTVAPGIVVIPPVKTVRFTISLSNGQTFTYFSDGSGQIQ